jgi:ribosomal protein S18 acetylase RimI-like enzyme
MIALRPAEEKDDPFIMEVYRSTREEELKFTQWTEQQKQAFIRMQSTAQLAEYRSKYPGAAFRIITCKKKDAGRFYTWESEQEIRLIDITLLPAFRGKGIGSFLLNELVKKADKLQKKISLHVEPANPVMQLYLRLGFIHLRNNGRHYYMERNPEVFSNPPGTEQDHGNSDLK